jgi:hypothetical protein
MGWKKYLKPDREDELAQMREKLEILSQERNKWKDLYQDMRVYKLREITDAINHWVPSCFGHSKTCDCRFCSLHREVKNILKKK